MLPQNTDVPVAFTVPTTLLSASWRIRGPNTGTLGDLTNGVIQNWSTIDLSTQTTPGVILLTVPAALNLITSTIQISNSDGTTTTAPAVRESRVVDLQCLTSGQPTSLTSLDYMIGSDEQLVLMQNSFQIYPSACEYATEIPNLTSWPSAPADQRVTALTQAFQKLSRLNYEIYYDRDDVYFRNRASWGLPFINTIGRLYNYTATDFLALDPDFIMKIRRAQVIEADDLMGGDPILAERERGILSSTVGQTSHMFRPGKALKTTICRRAMEELSGYLKYNYSLVRS